MRPGRAGAVPGVRMASRSRAASTGAGKIPVVEGLCLSSKIAAVRQVPKGSPAGKGGGAMKTCGHVHRSSPSPWYAVPASGAVGRRSGPLRRQGRIRRCPRRTCRWRSSPMPWQTLPLLPRRFQNHCGFYRGPLLLRRPLRSELPALLLLAGGVRLLSHRSRLLRRRRQPALHDVAVSVRLKGRAIMKDRAAKEVLRN